MHLFFERIESRNFLKPSFLPNIFLKVEEEEEELSLFFDLRRLRRLDLPLLVIFWVFFGWQYGVLCGFMNKNLRFIVYLFYE